MRRAQTTSRSLDDPDLITPPCPLWPALGSRCGGYLRTEFSTQTAALKNSLASMSSTVKEVTSSPSKANLSQVPGQVAAVSTAVKDLAGAASPKTG